MNWNSMRALLAGIPALPDARCRGRAALFEATIAVRHGGPARAELENARREALTLCHACPALALCRSWLAAMPATRRPRGVVAGVVVTASGLPARTRTPSAAVERAPSGGNCVRRADTIAIQRAGAADEATR